VNRPLPYEALIQVGVIQSRINGLAQELYGLDNELGQLISEQLGLATMADAESDQVCVEFSAAVEARLEGEGVS